MSHLFSKADSNRDSLISFEESQQYEENERNLQLAVEKFEMSISHQELFLKQQELLSKKVLENTEIDIDFNCKINDLKKHFLELKEVAKKTDVSFVGAVNAQEKKQIKGLENLQKRLLRAEKRRQKELVDRITTLQNQLLPNQSLEERQRNFSDYYLAYGPAFLDTLKAALKPLAHQFTIIELS